MIKRDIVKLVATTIGGFGVSKVVKDIISNNTTCESTSDSVKIWVGSLVIGSMIAHHTNNYIEAKINSAAAQVDHFKEKWNEESEK